MTNRIAQCQKALEIDPHYANALWFLALSLEQKGDLSGAIAKLEKAASLSRGPHYQALLGRTYALASEKCKALEILNELNALSRQRYISSFDIAVVHLRLGDRASAFEYFEEAYQQRVFRIIELVMPMYDSLRSDSRWRDLVATRRSSPIIGTESVSGADALLSALLNCD
jgi:tetratricopeptide (TPR) repeat protein